MAKVRVYELAKEFGVESKVVMAKLQELGEFVRSASSTVEAPVVRKLKETLPRGGDGAAAPTSTSPTPMGRATARPGGPSATPARPGPSDGGAQATPAAPSAPAAPAAPVTPASPARPAGPRPGVPLSAVPTPAEPAAPAAPATPVAPAGPAEPVAPAAASAAPATPAAPAAPSPAGPPPATPATAGGAPRPGGGPRPGNNPFSSGASTGMGRPSGPRPGNNPFSSGASTGMGRPAAPSPHAAPGAPAPGAPGQAGAGAAGPAGSQAARTGSSGAGGPRPGGPRPGSGFAGQGDRGAPGGGQGAGPGGPRPNPGMMPPRPQQRPGGGPGGFAGRPAGPGGPGARPGGPGGAGGPGGFAGRPGGGAGGPGGAGRPGGGGGGFAGRPGGGAPGAGPGAGGGGFAGRPGGGGPRGRGGTAGAFGRPGGRPTRGRKSKKQRRQEFDNMQAPSIGGVQVPHGDGSTPVRLRRGSTLTDFAEKIGANPASLVTVLFTLGEMATATQSLDADTFAALGNELGFDVQIVSAEDEDSELLESFDMNLGDDLDEEDELEARPPVVTVMGHVDHGKTRLLDAIRKTNVQAREAGGITQHIGAYQVHHTHQDVERAITFIDTPGHEAFTAMRARGAKTTDIVILVVAADDGVMPQTIEALNHALAAEVPIVVAVNKVDKEGANPGKVRQQLTEYGLVAEEYGGETMFVDVSALSGIGIDALLEAVLLTADASLELIANPHADARGVAIEAHLDRGRGPVATVLVQRGTLRVGDSIVAGTAFGRVRALLDDNGEQIDEAGPSRPVMVLGLTSVPGAGDSFLVTQEDRVARQIAERRGAAERNALLAKARKRVSLEDLAKILEQGRIETLNLILKGDVSGSVEALEDALLKIDVGDLVDLRIIHRGVGSITEHDITLASASEAIVIGFNVRPEGRARELAEREGIDVRFYSVIYAAIDDVELALTGLLKPEYEEAQLGTAEVREIFRSSKFGNIAGCLVRSGEIRRNTKARVLRNGAMIADNLQIQSLKRFKDDATEVREGFECGIGLGSYNDLQVDDVIETFEMREKPRS